MMEFTKKEKRVLSQKEWPIRFTFWAGVIFILAAIGIVPYAFLKLGNVRNIWREAHAVVQSVHTETELESMLKEKALLATDFVATNWYDYQVEKLGRLVIIFWIIGCFLIGHSKREKLYKGLLQKLQKP